MIICTDLDGTLLTSKNVVSEKTGKSLRRAEAKGHYVVLASSRPPRSVQRIALELGLKSTIRISLNGSFVFEEDHVLANIPIPRPNLFGISELVSALDLHLSAYTEWAWWSRQRDEVLATEESMVGFAADIVGGAIHRALNSNKLMVVGFPERILELQRLVIQSMSDVSATLSKPDYCEIVARGVSKASGLETVCAHLECEPQDVIAFGDGENDIELLRFAGTAVAMGNAIEALKSVASIVALDHDHDGIEAVLQHLDLV